jgi:hypothetical protein
MLYKELSKIESKKYSASWRCSNVKTVGCCSDPVHLNAHAINHVYQDPKYGVGTPRSHSNMIRKIVCPRRSLPRSRPDTVQAGVIYVIYRYFK